MVHLQSDAVVTDEAGVQPRPQPKPLLSNFGLQTCSRT